MHANLLDILFRDPLFKQAGLQYVWPLDEATGLIRQSYSPPWACVPSAHMQPVNGPTQTTGLFGPGPYALGCSRASAQSAQTPSQASIQHSQSGWWGSCWVYHSSISSNQSIVSKYGGSSNEWYVWLASANYWQFQTYGGSTKVVNTSTTASINTWYFLLWWWDPVANTINIRVNNATVDRTAYTGTAIPQSNSPFCVGALTNASTFALDGRVQGVCIGYPRVPIGSIINEVSRTLYANGSGLDLVRRMPLATNFVGPVPGTRPLAWYKADGVNYQTAGGSPATADGDPVGYLTDFSGMGYSPTRTGTARPTLKTNIQNGLPVIRFDGVDDYLSYTLPGTFAGSPLHVFAVANTTSGANDDALMDISGNFKSISFQDPSGVPSLCGISISAGDTTSLASGDFSGTVKVVISAKINNASSTIRINGTQVASGDAGGTRNGSVLYIGNDSSITRFFYGDIAEMIIYGGNLSSTDEQAVEAYLNAKWAVY